MRPKKNVTQQLSAAQSINDVPIYGKARGKSKKSKAKSKARTVDLSIQTSRYPTYGVGLMVNDQGAKRLIVLGNFENISLLKTSRSLRIHPCRIPDHAQTLGSSARTVLLTSGLTLHRKLKSRDRTRSQKKPIIGIPLSDTPVG